MSKNDIELAEWYNFIKIGYKTRPQIPWHERKIKINISKDCFHNLDALFGLVLEDKPLDEVEFVTNDSTQFSNTLSLEKIRELLSNNMTRFNGIFGALEIQQEDGPGIFQIKFE